MATFGTCDIKGVWESGLRAPWIHPKAAKVCKWSDVQTVDFFVSLKGQLGFDSCANESIARSLGSFYSASV